MSAILFHTVDDKKNKKTFITALNALGVDDKKILMQGETIEEIFNQIDSVNNKIPKTQNRLTIPNIKKNKAVEILQEYVNGVQGIQHKMITLSTNNGQLEIMVAPKETMMKQNTKPITLKKQSIPSRLGGRKTKRRKRKTSKVKFTKHGSSLRRHTRTF